MTQRNLCTDEIYHVYNRGVDKRIVFTNTEEYAYFIHLLFALNNLENVFNVRRKFSEKNKKLNHNDGGPTSIISTRLVDVMAFALMPNHYHLILKQNVDEGISKFMHKLGTGYTMFFNARHERSGALFQGKYKSVHVNNNRQLLYLPHYIHLNPIQEKKFSSQKEKENYLELYKWSSYIDYVKGGNFPSVTQREAILTLFGSSKSYEKDMMQYVKNKKILRSSDDVCFID